MQIIEVSRRKFLQGTVYLSIYASTVSGSRASLPTAFTSKTSGSKAESVPYLCNMCRNKCAGFARVENGIVTKLDPNPWFPKSRNMLCPKGNAGIQALYDPDRLKYPLVRIGKRGEGKYRRVTWDEAYEKILKGSRLFKGLEQILDEEKDNRSTIAYCNGEGFNKDEFIKFFGGKLGSSNFLDEGSICLNTKLGASVLTIGDVGEPDVAGSDFVIICGANRFESLITPDSIDLMRDPGKKLVVLDPRCTVTALKADRYFPIRPGTDLALCLAMTWVAVRYGLYDETFVETYFEDFDHYRKHIIGKNYTPAWAEAKTGIPSGEIEKLAKDFFAARRPLFYPGRRSVWAENDFQFRRAIVLLNALAGSINRKGGIIFGNPIHLPEEEIGIPIYANSRERFDLDGIVYGSAKGGSWLNFRDKILDGTAPYPVRAMFIRKHNLMQNMPNISKTRRMLEHMDLIVMMDTMPCDTALMADVILPECTYLEREDMVVSFNRLEPSLALRNRVLDPMYESRNMQEILADMGRRFSVPLFNISARYDADLRESIKEMGREKAYRDGGYDLAELYRKEVKVRNRQLIVRHFGAEVYDSLKKRGVWYPGMEKYRKEIVNGVYEYYPEDKKHYKTDRNFRVKCRLEKLEENGFDPMPAWRDEYDFRVEKGKFRLITGRYVMFTQSATANNAVLRDLKNKNALWINDKTAANLGIRKGDMVEVVSKTGKVVLQAWPTNRILPDVVWFAHGFGIQNDELEYAYAEGASDNMLIEDRFEKIYGCAVMHHTDVCVRRV